MTEALVHRGPDSGGVTLLGRCVLGHRRLRVVDLATGDQPATNETEEVVAVFNGELYDFAEVRRDLAARGHDVPGTGDTAVIPHVYEEQGADFPAALSGMFAIALWDSTRERLVLARDRIGKKPLHYRLFSDGSLAFASELKALLLLPGIARELDPAALDAYLALQYVPGEETGVGGIRRVLPGHVLTWERGRVATRSYWELRPEPEDLGDDAWLERVRETVTAAVRRRLVSDVPLGALLSGGIDSTIVVGLMAQESSEPVKTFTVGVDDARYDEREHARVAASAFGTVHEELVVEPDPVELVSRLAGFLDEPLGDEAILPTFLISEVARRHVTVALTGDGGDESFAGYERYAAMGLSRSIGRVPVVPGLAARGLRALPGGKDPRAGRARVARLLATAALPASERYGALMEVFPAALRSDLYTPSFAASLGPPRGAAALLGTPPVPGIAGLQLLDARTYLPDDLLVKADRASMATSLELRSPLLDHRVLELGVSLPDSLRFSRRRGKVALRRAFAHLLPPELATRRKTGFGVPLGDWFRGPLRELAGDVLLGGRARARGQVRPEVGRAPARRARARRAGPRPPPLVPARARALAAVVARVRAPGLGRIRPGSMTRRVALAVVIAAAVVPRLLVLLAERGQILSELVEKSDRFAQTLVASGTFGFLPGRPSGYTQPLYAWFLAGLYQVLERHWLVVGLAHIAVAATTAVLVLEIGRRVVSLEVGVVGATIATLHPFLVWHDMHVNREILDGLLLAAVTLLALIVVERRGWLLALGLGAAAGLAVLGNARLALLPLVLAGFVAWPFRPAGRSLALAGVVLAGAVLVVTPWMARNQASVGCFVLTTDSRALWKANNPSTRETLDRGQWIDDVPEPPGGPAVARARSRPHARGHTDRDRRVRAAALLPRARVRLLARAAGREGAALRAGRTDALEPDVLGRLGRLGARAHRRARA